MNRRRGWILLTFGLLLAIGTGAVVFFVLQQQQQQLAARAREMAVVEAPPMATMKLPVAARPLPAGTLLTSGDLILKDFPLDLVPIEAITETITLEQQILVEPIGQGETFNPTKLAGDAAGSISRQIPVGRVIFAYPINNLMSEINIVENGDRIDLMATLQVTDEAGTAEPVTAFTLQNIEVFEVLRPGIEDEEADEVRPIALLLSVTPEDAVLLKHVKDSGGILDFVLRAKIDNEVQEIPPVDRDDFLDRYGIRKSGLVAATNP
ncbi:MAG: Flp pilus assembly protein CpaB [Oscillochloris sp.]|nr:Flp pilus assembly protein CpaB [Oscillochloris sp.]